MKTAICIEDEIVQLVLTPKTEFEKNALRPGTCNNDINIIYESPCNDHQNQTRNR